MRCENVYFFFSLSMLVNLLECCPALCMLLMVIMCVRVFGEYGFKLLCVDLMIVSYALHAFGN